MLRYGPLGIIASRRAIVHPDSVSSQPHSRLVAIGTPVPPFRLGPSVVSRALAPE